MIFYRLILISAFLAFINLQSIAQVPKIGDSLKLEIANWNLEWFGKSGYGPTDEALQQANVLDVIRKADMDIWVFCEVSNTVVFDSLMAKLPDYNYTICNYLPEQKTAVIFKKDQFRLIKAELLGTNNPDSFTTMRFPFSVVLKSLLPKSIDTLNLIALHLKANIGTNAEKLSAYNSRLRSGEWLKMYLNKNMHRYTLVAGDWNDDLDESIYNALPSPFSGMQEQDFKYDFITRKFTDKHIGTTTSYPDAIDHQLISLPLKDYLMYNSTSIFYLDQYINNYSSTTSDHYPVYSVFNRYSSLIYNISLNNSIYLYPNPAHQFFRINFSDTLTILSVRIIDMNGKCMVDKTYNTDDVISITGLPPGCYQVVVVNNKDVYSVLLNINN